MLNVEIQNFQSIVKTELQIQGFTALTGRNNLGKSATLRAIKAALFGASGSGFIRDGAKACTVRVEAEGLDVTWRKTATSASYNINGEAYEKPGRNRPPEMENAGFREIIANKEKLRVQFSEQLDPLFLVNRTGGAAAEVLLSVARMEQLTDATRSCLSDLSKERQALKLREADQESLEEQRLRFENLPGIQLGLTGAGTALADLEGQQKNLTDLQAVQQALQGFQRDIAVLAPAETVTLPEITVNTQRLESYRKAHKHLEATKSVVGLQDPQLPDVDWTVLKGQAQNLRDYRDLYQQWVSTKDIPDAQVTLPDTQALLELQQTLKDLRQVQSLNLEIQGIDQDLTHLDEELATADDNCPLCGTQLAVPA
jgi:DNA repair exonuclease SbcCD ATPase subunit